MLSTMLQYRSAVQEIPTDLTVLGMTSFAYLDATYFLIS